MPTTSLDDLNFEESDKKITSSKEPAGTESGELVPQNFWEGDVSGEITARDKKFPRLNIGQKSGNIGEEKGLGALVLNRDIGLLTKFSGPIGPTLPGVVVVKIQKLYQEKREYDPSSTQLPRVFNTSKEANAAGFSTEYGDEKFVAPVALMLLLVPAPSDLDKGLIEQEFPYDYNGSHYLAAGFFAAGTSWHEAAKPVFTALDAPKARELGLRSIRWNMQIIRRTGIKGAWFAMKLSATGYNHPELINFTKERIP